MKRNRAITNFVVIFIILVMLTTMLLYSACLKKIPQYKINSINHRGYYTAPENTITAFRKSKEVGFSTVECDLQFTSDDCPVIIHDYTIDRTSNGTGEVSKLTYDEIRQYDFGGWKAEEFIGERIPSFEEFISLCSKIELKAYVELKATITDERALKLNGIVEKYNMENNVSWISFSFDSLSSILNVNSEYRAGIVVLAVNEDLIGKVNNYRKENKNIFIDCEYRSLDDDSIALCKNNNIKLESWSVNEIEAIERMDRYISGVTSDMYIAEKVVNEFERR